MQIGGRGSRSNYVLCFGRKRGKHFGTKCWLHLGALQGMEGLSFGKREAKLGWNAQPTTAVMLDDVRVPEAMRLGQVRRGGKGFEMRFRSCDWAGTARAVAR